MVIRLALNMNVVTRIDIVLVTKYRVKIICCNVRGIATEIRDFQSTTCVKLVL